MYGADYYGSTYYGESFYLFERQLNAWFKIIKPIVNWIKIIKPPIQSGCSYVE